MMMLVVYAIRTLNLRLCGESPLLVFDRVGR